MANLRIAHVLPLGLLLAGCPIYGSEEPVTRVVEVSCVSDFDCPLDSFCDLAVNECVALDFGICLTDGDCPVGSYCDPADQGCYVSPDTDCTVDRDCNTGFECDFRDTCRPERTGSCLVDGDCNPGDLCIENACTPLAATCQYDFQCAAGFTCANNRCRLLCGPDTDCPSGTRCDDNLCEPVLGECVDSGDCPDLATNCVESVCLRRCEEGCDATTEVCDAEGFCRPRTLPDPNAPVPFCRGDEDCAGTSLCVQGICRTQCDSTAPDADVFCASLDGQLPFCGPDNFCYAQSEIEAECATQTDCLEGEDCIDGQCR